MKQLLGKAVPVSPALCSIRQGATRPHRLIPRGHQPRRVGVLAAAMVVSLALSASPASGTVPADVSGADVHWWWDAEASVGTSQLVRTDAGISARVTTSGLPAGQAVTLWFIIFNHPAGCSTRPCSIPADVFNDAAGADFYFGGGHVVGGADSTSFGGHLAVGQTRGSGKAELAEAGVGFFEAVPLTAPRAAEVVLALHSHGPALTGPALAHQISSFLGGCQRFNGPDGFAAGPGDIPDAQGECSTLQYSRHS